jgi:hypothetical protein
MAGAGIKSSTGRALLNTRHMPVRATLRHSKTSYDARAALRLLFELLGSLFDAESIFEKIDQVHGPVRVKDLPHLLP